MFILDLRRVTSIFIRRNNFVQRSPKTGNIFTKTNSAINSSTNISNKLTKNNITRITADQEALSDLSSRQEKAIKNQLPSKRLFLISLRGSKNLLLLQPVINRTIARIDAEQESLHNLRQISLVEAFLKSEQYSNNQYSQETVLRLHLKHHFNSNNHNQRQFHMNQF